MVMDRLAREVRVDSVVDDIWRWMKLWRGGAAA